jgi:hypothetical protein
MYTTGMAGLPASASAAWSTSTENKTYAAWAKTYDVPVSTFWHRVHGRQSRSDTAVTRQYLTPSEEKALRDKVLRIVAQGYFVTPKFLRYLAQWIVRQRSSTFQIQATDDGVRLPNKNWPAGFYERQGLKSRTLKPLEWERHNIYEKVAHWFTVIGRELHAPTTLAENVYNMDETGIMLSHLTSRKVLLHRNDLRRHRGAGSKRVQVTAIECISADGRCLNPLIIWPTLTIRSDWTTHPTPGWHFTCSPSGYNNSVIALEWFRRVFDPQTRSRANGRPRILINDGFTAHESLEVLQFCHENNIILCRLPSHTSHKLQPCDVAVFGPLKTAYRERVENLYRGGANSVGKQHFPLIYSQSRSVAFIPENIEAAWAKAGLYPWNPDRVLLSIPEPSNQEAESIRIVDTASSDVSLQTPVTSEDFASLRRRLEQNVHLLDADSQLYWRKLANAGERATAARDLLFKENHDLFKQNNESNTRVSRKSNMVGKGKVMSYEDIEEAVRKRDVKDAAGTGRRGRKRKDAASVPVPKPRRRSRAAEVKEARKDIIALGMEGFCSVLQF